MVSVGLVRELDRRFSVSAGNVILDSKIWQQVIQKSFLRTLKETSRLAIEDFRNPEQTHFCSSFSIRSEKLPTLAAELQKLGLQFVDDHEDSEGTRVVSLAITLI